MSATSAAAMPEPPDLEARPNGARGSSLLTDPWALIRFVLGSLYASCSIAFVLAVGVVFDRKVVTAWVLGALLIGCVGRSRREAFVTVASWMPFLVSVALYEVARGGADNLGRPLVETPQLLADVHLFGPLLNGDTPTTFLQRALFSPDQTRWYDVVVSIVYFSHFIAPYLLAGLLWHRARERWRLYTVTFVALAASSCATFALFPTMPPWMAADEGRLPKMERLVSRGWEVLGLGRIGELISSGQDTVNPVAAVPSLHGAHSLLVAIFALTLLKRRWLKVAVALYPLAMCFTLTYGGEHYVSDVLVGWTYVAVLLLLSRRAMGAFSRRYEAARVRSENRRAHPGAGRPAPA